MLNNMKPFYFLYWKMSTDNRWITTKTGVLMIGEANEGSDTSVFDFGSFCFMAVTLL